MPARVLLLQRGPCPHYPHLMQTVSRRRGCTYEQCMGCETRRIVIERGGVEDAAWLRSGEFSSGLLFKVSLQG